MARTGSKSPPRCAQPPDEPGRRLVMAQEDAEKLKQEEDDQCTFKPIISSTSERICRRNQGKLKRWNDAPSAAGSTILSARHNASMESTGSALEQHAVSVDTFLDTQGIKSPKRGFWKGEPYGNIGGSISPRSMSPRSRQRTPSPGFRGDELQALHQQVQILQEQVVHLQAQVKPGRPSLRAPGQRLSAAVAWSGTDPAFQEVRKAIRSMVL